jgi:hypothetical protein
MAIVWGTQRTEKFLGFAADFCLLCRDIRPFRVSQVGLVDHLYYIPLGQAKPISHFGECVKCGTQKSVDPKNYKAFVNFAATSDIESLAQMTYPNVRNDYAERLELEQCIKDHQILMPAERNTILMESFMIFAGKVQDRYANFKFDKESGMGCIGLLVMPGLLFCGFTFIQPFSDRALNIYSIVLTLIGCIVLVYTVIQSILTPGRFIRREIMPALARTILPINPTYQEISQYLSHCRKMGLKIGKVREEKLWETLQNMRKTI